MTSGYAHRTVTKPPDWHALVVADVLLNNLTTGLFLVAAAGDLCAPSLFGPVAGYAYPLALIFLTLDLLCLVMDLGDPLRFHHMLRVFKPSSPMSLGTWCLTAYSLPLTILAVQQVATWVGLLPGDTAAEWWVRKGTAAAGLVPAFGSAVYKGVLFSTTAQPGWKDARWFGGYLVNSAVVLGAAVGLALALGLGDGRAAAALRPAVAVLVVLNVVPLVLLRVELAPTLATVFARGRRRLGDAVVLGIGSVVPAGLFLAGGGLGVAAAVGLLIAGSVLVRFVLIWLPRLATHGADARHG